MNLESTFPLRYLTNLKHRSDRLARVKARLKEVQLTAEVLNGVDGKSFKDAWGFNKTSNRAIAINNRLAIRSAKVLDAPAVLLFEDDIVFHPEFRARVEAIELPEDWGIFYFGCQHIETPEFVSPGIVRVKRALDTHAIAIRKAHYDALIEVLADGPNPEAKQGHTGDVAISTLHSRIPAYACFPNLIWQEKGVSDNATFKDAFSNYEDDGSQAGPWAGAVATLKTFQDSTCSNQTVA